MKPSHILTAAVSLTLTGVLTAGLAANAAAVTPRLYMTSFGSEEEQSRILQQGGFLAAAPDADAAPAPSGVLPASYDMRRYGLCTAVKDQGSYSTCWAFSALNAFETAEIAQDPLIDLSEWHLAYYTYSDTFGYPYAANSPFDAGSFDCDQEIGMLTSWIGPVYEADAPYHDMSITDSTLTMEEVRAQSALHTIQAVSYSYDPEDTEHFSTQIAAVQSAIYEGHAIDVSYYHSDACFNEKTNAYCYHPDIADGGYGHSVSLVGWDDSFPASAFLRDPGRDGAWLAKNSWGTTWGDDGYFWISYADPRIGDLYALEAEPAQVHNRLYQHDQFGSSGAFSFSPGGDAEVFLANVFTAEENGWITSLMFCNLDANDAAEFTIYTGLTDANNPVSGKPSAATVKQFDRIGYQTLELDTPVPIKAGECFAVTAKVTGEGNGFRIPCEFATHTEQFHADGTSDGFDSGFTPEMLGRDFAAGQSFYSADSIVWYDMYHAEHGTISNSDEASGESTQVEMILGNICLKALTRDDGIVLFSDYHESIPAAQGIELWNDDHAPVYYSLDGIHFTLYEEPILFPEGESTMTISAYADMGDKTVFTRSYQKQAAALSSLLCKDAHFEWYADRDPEDPTRLHYYIDKSITSVDILPMTTGMLKIGDQEFPSGQTGTLSVKRGTNEFTLDVTQEGLVPAQYTLTIETLFSANFLRGDVNLDGKIDASDAADILVYCAAIGSGETPAVPDDEWLDRADFSETGVVDAASATDILVYAAEQGAGVNGE